MKITIAINEGNEAVQTKQDIVNLLNRKVYSGIECAIACGDGNGKILDLNGNTVGKWEVKK